jgi:IS30 family transposase
VEEVAEPKEQAMANYKHMDQEERIEIQTGLKEGKSFKEIGIGLGRDASTVAKEIKGHLIVKETGTRSRPYNPCKKRKNCGHEKDACLECIANPWDPRCGYCALCEHGCFKHCTEYEEETCRLLTKPPYVCNGCNQIRTCTLRKKVYDAKEAQKEYEHIRSESRQGICLNADELKRIDDIITPLVKNGQSIHHICVNNTDVIMLDERTIYNYVDAGLLSVYNIDLPRKVRYRKRKVKKHVRVDKQCHVGRSYEDYLKYMEEHPDTAVVQMDSVEGKRDSTKVLLTLYFTEVQFMLAFLRDANTARSVTEIFNRLDNLLGREKFKQMFPVILTDRGSEFTDPLGVECDEDGEIRTRVFYCDPQRSNQKGGCEVTHEMIRRVLPKGTSFKDLTQEKVDLMMNHINSYTRKKLNDRSAHQLFSFLFGDDVAEKLHSQPIDADEINLTPELLK